MKVRVNGEERELPEGVTIEAMLGSMGIPLTGMALEVNREIVPKRLFKEATLKPGDTVEIIRMVGGG